ncbi:hypothetical protein FQN54_002031 [Arachnomyces sp. PD_36]|nr:hypothetical protein FQN54_002031 [Arachnomyces sp. PD_36]
MSQVCVRVNPPEWVNGGSQDEEHAILVTVGRPQSHELFASKNVMFLGPLGIEDGGIPLRMLTIKPGQRGTAITGSQDADTHSFHVNTTTFYAHYASGEGLTAAQFEILWQFQRFARNERVPGIGSDLKDRILTLDGHKPEPRTAYDERNHQYVYQGWNHEHFRKFWEEYRMFKETVHVFHRYMKFPHNEKVEWRKLNPPRALTESEKKELEQDYKPKSLHEPPDPTKLDMTLDELVAKNQTPKKSPLRRAKNAGITKGRTPPRAAYDASPRKQGRDSSPSRSVTGSPVSRPKDIYGGNRANRFSRRRQNDRRNRRNSSQPNRFRNYQAPLTENNIRCFDALTGVNAYGKPQPRSPVPEETFTLGLVDPNKERLVDKYLEDQKREAEKASSPNEADHTPMELDD